MFLPFFSCFSQPFAYGTAVLPLRSCEETSEPSVPPVTRHPHTSPGRHWDSCHLRIVSAGSWINRNQVAKKYIPSLKLTARTWKWMVGILLSYWEGLFSRAMLVSGRVYPKALGPLPVTWQSCVKIQYLYIISIYIYANNHWPLSVFLQPSQVAEPTWRRQDPPSPASTASSFTSEPSLSWTSLRVHASFMVLHHVQGFVTTHETQKNI